MGNIERLYNDGFVIIYDYTDYNDICNELNSKGVRYRREVSTTSARERVWAIELIKGDE